MHEIVLPTEFHVEPIGLQHQKLLHPLLRAQNVGLCEFSYSILYVFGILDTYQLKVITTPRGVYLHSLTEEKIPYLMPTSLEAANDAESLKVLSPYYQFLFPIPDEWLSKLTLPGLRHTLKESESDYLFTLEKLVYYPGRELSSRRNLVHQFLAQYECESHPLTSENKADALQILKIWQQETDYVDRPSDSVGCATALELLEQLSLDGEIYYIDQKPVAFLIGEMITSEMFCIHFLKADRLYKGIYQYIYQDFARSLLNRAAWVNLEYDLGLESLRRAKSSYHPDKMAIKWHVDWART